MTFFSSIFHLILNFFARELAYLREKMRFFIGNNIKNFHNIKFFQFKSISFLLSNPVLLLCLIFCFCIWKFSSFFFQCILHNIFKKKKKKNCDDLVSDFFFFSSFFLQISIFRRRALLLQIHLNFFHFFDSLTRQAINLINLTLTSLFSQIHPLI